MCLAKQKVLQPWHLLADWRFSERIRHRGACHDLVADPMTCAKEVDPVLLCELFYLLVLLQVTGALILYIVIEGKD